MVDRNTVTALDAELVPNVNETTPEKPSTALAQIDPTNVEAAFARVEQAIAQLPNEVTAVEWRDELRAVEAVAVGLSRHDICAAAARAVAEVERWIAQHNPARRVGRPRKEKEHEKTWGGDPHFSDGEGGSGDKEPENLGRRPKFSDGEGGSGDKEPEKTWGGDPHFSDGEGGSGDKESVLPTAELREIRRAHPDPEDGAALRARMERIEAEGKVVSRRALREQVRREREKAAAEAAPQDTAAPDSPEDGSSTPRVPTDTAPTLLHKCALTALYDKVARASIDAVAVALPSTDDLEIVAVLGFAEWAVRSGGLCLVQCPVSAVANVVRIGIEPDSNDDCWMAYESLLACVEPGDDWFPVVVFRRRDEADVARERDDDDDDDADSDVGDDDDDADTAAQDDHDADSTRGDDDDTADSAVESDNADSGFEGPTLFRATTGSGAWRQVLTAWLRPGSEVLDPCCGCGDVLVGAAAAGMRIVGADADAANIAATQAALRAAAGVAPKRAVDPST